MAQKVTTILSSLSKNFGAAAGAIIVVLMIAAVVYVKTYNNEAELDTASGIRKQVMLHDERIKTNAIRIGKGNERIAKIEETLSEEKAHYAAVEAKLDVMIELLKSSRYVGVAASKFE